MAIQEQLDILKQGVETWNQWRKEHLKIKPDLNKSDLSHLDLSGADFSSTNLFNTNLSGANLRRARFYRARLRGAELINADLTEADLTEADFSSTRLGGARFHKARFNGVNLSHTDFRAAVLVEVDFSGVNLSGADLNKADLSNAILREADLSNANLIQADLHGANLSGANLMGATLVSTNLSHATLTNCNIYGISAWDVQLEGTEQLSLVITRPDQATITVDNLKVAQFIYLLLNNKDIRETLDTITYKVVLILGRFTPRRKAVLDALRIELRKHDYIPVVFDFEKPSSRNFTETVRTLAHLARFIIADLTDPRSISQELQAIIPNLAVPVQPVLLEGKREYALFRDLRRRYTWVLPTFRFQDTANLLASLKEHIIEPAEQKAKELAQP